MNLLKYTHTPPFPAGKITNHQYYLAATQTSKGWKVNDTESTAKAVIVPIEMEEIRTIGPMVILRYKGRVQLSQSLPLRAAAYDTFRTRTLLPQQEMKTA